MVAGGELGLFVSYTAHKLGGPAHSYVDVVARYQASAADPDRADPSGSSVLAIHDFASTHNGGMIEFGPDEREEHKGSVLSEDDARAALGVAKK